MIQLIMSSSNNVSSAPLDFSAAELVPGRKAISKTGDQQGLTLLPAEFVPGETDVICQRGELLVIPGAAAG